VVPEVRQPAAQWVSVNSLLTAVGFSIGASAYRMQPVTRVVAIDRGSLSHLGFSLFSSPLKRLKLNPLQGRQSVRF
jgi:hypothetical protein